MNFDKLADGATSGFLGLLPDEGFWLAIILILLAVVLELAIWRSVRDRKVLGLPPVAGATIVLAIISLLSFVAALLILFF